jgi:mono/diheme cytochrome c family protein
VQPRQSKRTLRPLAAVVLVVVLGAGVFAAVFAARNWTAVAKARKLVNPVPATAEALAAGMQAYTQHCQSCHGEKGDGKGEKASELSVAPGDFTDTEKLHSATDGELFWQITKGRLPMPAFQHKLDDRERWELVDYIRTFEGKPTDSPPTIR